MLHQTQFRPFFAVAHPGQIRDHHVASRVEHPGQNRQPVVGPLVAVTEVTVADW